MNNNRKIRFLQILILLAHLFLIFIMSKPYIGIDVKHIKNDQLIISNVYHDDGWAQYTDIAIGDSILEVDNHKITHKNFQHGTSIKIMRNNEIHYIKAPPGSQKDTFQEILIPAYFL